MQLAKNFNGQKFMWDGATYPDEKSAQDAAKKYNDDGFTVEIIQEEGNYFIFSRKHIKEFTVEGQ